MMMYGRQISLIDLVADLVAPGSPVVALRPAFVVVVVMSCESRSAGRIRDCEEQKDRL